MWSTLGNKIKGITSLGGKISNMYDMYKPLAQPLFRDASRVLRKFGKAGERIGEGASSIGDNLGQYAVGATAINPMLGAGVGGVSAGLSAGGRLVSGLGSQSRNLGQQGKQIAKSGIIKRYLE